MRLRVHEDRNGVVIASFEKYERENGHNWLFADVECFVRKVTEVAV